MPKPLSTQSPSDKEYIKELEKVVIFLCDVYTKGQDSLACQTTESEEVDEKWYGIMMSFDDIYERLKVGRRDKELTSLNKGEQ